MPIADDGLHHRQRRHCCRIRPQDARAERDGGHEGQGTQHGAFAFRESAFRADQHSQMFFADGSQFTDRIVGGSILIAIDDAPMVIPFCQQWFEFDRCMDSRH